MSPQRCRDIAHVSAVVLHSQVPAETVDFFVRLMGLSEVARAGTRTYLRTWDDYERFTVCVVDAPASGIGRTWLRAAGPEALERRVRAIEDSGLGLGWAEGEEGIGPTYRFTDPDGHEFGIYWESEWYEPPEGQRPALKNQAAPFPGRGANVRRLDHVNYLAADIPAVARYLPDVLGAELTEQIVMDDGVPSAVWYHVGDKSYDLVYTSDWTASTGRLHHVAFATDQREDILRAADVMLEAGIHIETGPHKHAIQQTFFLYVYEPGGNRIELCNAGARLVLAPDWRPISWSRAERAKGQAWGLRSVFYKGMAAAAIEALHAARAAGCEDWLREHIAAELAAADVGTLARLERGSYQHARRREHEMAAATDLLNELSVPPRVTRASQRWLNQLATEG